MTHFRNSDAQATLRCMELWEIDGDASLALRQAGAEDDAPPAILAVARRLLGASVSEVPHQALPGDGCLVWVHGRPRIYVRTGLLPARLRWVVGHELGHFVLQLDSSTRENEVACDAFAAAILVPRRAFQCAIREAGRSYTRLSRWFVTSESCVALRLGEVTDEPMALVAPSGIRLRGGAFVWPSEEGLRRLATGRRRRGIRKARLRDAPLRVALRVG